MPLTPTDVHLASSSPCHPHRQFVKRKRVSSQPAGGPTKKARDNKENVEKEASTSRQAVTATKMEASSPDISLISKYLPAKPKRLKKGNRDLSSEKKVSGNSLVPVEDIRPGHDLEEGSSVIVEDRKFGLKDETKVVENSAKCASVKLGEPALKPTARVQPQAGGAAKDTVKPRMKSPEPKIPESREKSPESRKKSPEPTRKKSPAPRKRSKEPRKDSKEQRTKSPDHVEKSSKPRLGSSESRRKTPEAKTIPNILKKSPEARKKTPEPNMIKSESRKRTPEPRKQTLEPRKQSPIPRMTTPELGMKTPEGSRSKSEPRKRSQEPVYNIDGVVGQWWCSVHKENFKTRTLLREHRGKNSCFNLKTPPAVAESAIIVSPIVVPKELAESR